MPKHTLLSVFVLLGMVFPLAAQCPDPNWEGTQCNPSAWWCQPDESCYWYGGWTSVVQYKCDGYDPSIGQFNSCTTYVAGCSNECVNHITTTRSEKPKSFLQMNILDMVIRIMPHPLMAWRPIGQGGRCVRVRI